MVCDSDGFRIHEYWTLPAGLDNQATEEEWSQRVLSCLRRAVQEQMVSDVPLGAFLSGGIDSSCVVALMAQASDRPVKTYSIGFEGSSGGSYYNELPYARQVAELFKTDHREIIVNPDVATLLPGLLWHMDEPIGDAAFTTTFLVAQFARQDVTVILSGVGGDELFGGYRRYLGEYYSGYYDRLPAWLRHSLLTPIAHRLPSDRHTPLMNLSRYAKHFILSNHLSSEDRYRSYVEVLPRERRDRLLSWPPGMIRIASRGHSAGHPMTTI